MSDTSKAATSDEERVDAQQDKLLTALRRSTGHPLLQLEFTTVRLTTEDPTGARYNGTGFFYLVHDDGDASAIPAIVTNRHVVEGMTRTDFTLMSVVREPSNTDPRALLQDFHQIHDVTMEGSGNNWWYHPDRSIDLAITPAAPILEGLEKATGRDALIKAFSRENMITCAQALDGLSPIEEVIMVGYPAGLADFRLNKPLFRAGRTSTHCGRHLNGRPEFLIDVACMSGSSGSPVVRLGPLGPITDGQFPDVDAQLVGILHGSPHLSHDFAVEYVQHSGGDGLRAKVEIPLNLGYCIHAERLLDFQTLPQIREALRG